MTPDELKRLESIESGLEVFEPEVDEWALTDDMRFLTQLVRRLEKENERLREGKNGGM